MLAFACAFTMFAGAAFTDAADIENAEAVDMLTSLGVIDGYADGSFRPEATITRAEMAKMIFTIRNGGNDDASAYAGVSTSFTDINDHWAEGYIKYCQVNGIISGKSATSFDPEGKVTVVETAKMALAVMGYNETRANLTGTGWDIRTLALATDNSLLDGVVGSVTAPITRDEAAQLLYNTIDADCVLWSNDKETFVKDTYTVGTTTNTWSVGTKYLDLIDEKGVLTSVNYDDNDDVYTTVVTGAKFTGGSISFDATSDNSALMGREVQVLYKIVKDEPVLFGMYATSKNKTVTTLYDDADISGNTATIDKTDYDITGITTIATNGTVISNSDYNAWTNFPYAEVTIVDNDNDKVYEYAVVNPFKVGKITTLTSSKIYTSNTNVASADLDDCNVYEGAAKNDWVAVTESKYAVSGKNEVVKAEVVTGKIDGTRSDAVRIDGTWYKQVTGAQAPTSASGDAEAIVVNGFYFNLEASESTTTDVAYVAEKTTADWGTSYDGKVRLVLPDGKIVTTNYELADGADVAAGNLVLYSSKDGYYELEVADTDNTGFDAAIGASKYYDNEKIDTTRIADDAVVFVKYSADEDGKYDYKVITGKALKAWGDVDDSTWAATGFTVTTNGVPYAKAVAVAANKDMPGATSDTVYGIVADNDAWTAEVDDTDYIYANIATTGDAVAYRFEDSVSNADLSAMTKGALVSFEIIDGDLVNNVKVLSLQAGIITGYTGLAKDDVVAVAYMDSGVQKAELTITDDTKIVYIDAEEAEAQADVGIQEPQSTGENDHEYFNNVYFVKSEANDDATVIFVDYTNTIADDSVTTLDADLVWNN